MGKTAKNPASGGKQGPAAAAKRLSPAAERALAEAQTRREIAAGKKAPKEIDGRGSLDPVRFGDWEVKGLASDF